MSTILSFLFGALLFWAPLKPEIPWNELFYPLMLIPAFFLGIYFLFQNNTLAALHHAEEFASPRLLEYYAKDRHLLVAGFLLSALLLTATLIGFAFAIFELKHILQILAIWLLLFGISLDLVHFIYKRNLKYLNPFAAVKICSDAGIKSIQNEKELDLCGSIDTLTETAIKGIENSSPSIAMVALEKLELLTRHFLEASKSISHHLQDSQSKAMGIGDKVSFTLFYLFQRLVMINEKALRPHFEPVCTSVVTNLGKIALHATKFDISLTGYPIFFMGKCARRAQSFHIADTVGKATIALTEVAKRIPEEVDVRYLELKDPYDTIILQLHEISKEIFRQDKSTDIAFLVLPFKDLQALFSSGKLAEHQDTPAILERINQVLAEFDALQVVMNTLPPIPKGEEFEKPSLKTPEKGTTEAK